MLSFLSNTMCNNGVFSSQKIDPMHESMERLYRIAEARGGIRRQSELATALNESQQAVKNWESRGISKDGALKAQAVFDVDANWLLVDGPASQLAAFKAKEPAAPYSVSRKTDNWPFAEVTRADLALLTDKEREHLERDIKLRIEGREEKQIEPARSAPRSGFGAA